MMENCYLHTKMNQTKETGLKDIGRKETGQNFQYKDKKALFLWKKPNNKLHKYP